MSYPEDDFEWGKEECFDALLDDYPALDNDPVFNSMFDHLFDDPLNWDEANEAYDELEQYLRDEYDFDLDDYFDWDDWRAEHADS